MLHALADLTMPTSCAGCERRGPDLCDRCRWGLRETIRRPLGWVQPDPCPPGLPSVWAIAPYAGTLRDVVVAHKDRGRVGLLPELATLWRGALAGLIEAAPQVRDAVVAQRLVVVPAPSSSAARRERGRDAWCEVVGSAVAGSPSVPMVNAVRLQRSVADQAGLDATRRQANLSGAMGVPRRLDLHDQCCVVADDVITTGATIAEAARALRAAGAGQVWAVVLAATSRRPS